MAFSNDRTDSRASIWTARVVSALVAVAFLGSAVAKLTHAPMMVEGLTHAGIPPAAIVPIGILELCLVVLYVFPRTSILGTFLLAGFVGGAIVTHIIGRESFAPPLVVGILMFAGAYLRHAELRALVPFRSVPAVRGKFFQREMSVLS